MTEKNAAPSGITMEYGTIDSGDLESLFTKDRDYLIMESSPVDGYQNLRYEIRFPEVVGLTRMEITIQGVRATKFVNQNVYAWNYNTATWIFGYSMDVRPALKEFGVSFRGSGYSGKDRPIRLLFTADLKVLDSFRVYLDSISIMAESEAPEATLKDKLMALTLVYPWDTIWYGGAISHLTGLGADKIIAEMEKGK
jgi:hypothetical protein